MAVGSASSGTRRFYRLYDCNPNRSRRARFEPTMRASSIALIAASCLVGCATPVERFDARVHAAGLAPRVVKGATFDHLVVEKPGDGSALHVYIEGDGTPWQTLDIPSNDPTPRTPVAFELMLRDQNRAIYLGRPCYFGVRGQRCEVLAWTHERYSDRVVQSMASALSAARSSGTPVVLIGHSGGGVVAVLLARRIDDVEAVVTIGANLDVAAWAALHRYAPLSGSLDPAGLPPAMAPQEQHHVGSADRVVPAAQLRAYARGRPNVEIVEWEGFDHVCCWSDVWTEILATVAHRDRRGSVVRNLR